jgi:hypothetical protein
VTEIESTPFIEKSEPNFRKGVESEYSISDRNVLWPVEGRAVERPPESAKGGGFAMLRIREGIGAMAEGRGRATGAARADDGVGCVPLVPSLVLFATPQT